MKENPKQACGRSKASMSSVPPRVLLELGIGMGEGAIKYGPYNYRESVIVESDYYDALMRHIFAYWEGENIDPDSQMSHITKAICTLVVWRDAMIGDNTEDDRPPASEDGWMEDLNKIMQEVRDKLNK